MNILRIALLTVLSAAGMAGCGGPIVRSNPNDHALESTGVGSVSYYLPDRLFTLSFTRTYVASRQFAAFNDAKAGYAGAEEELARLQRQLSVAEATLAAGIVPGETRKEIARLKYLIGAAEADLKDANDLLTTTKDAFNATRTVDNNCAFNDVFTLTPQNYVADITQRFRARLVHRVGRKDILTLGTTSSGLLSNGTSVASDQSSAIAQAIGRLVGAPAGLHSFALSTDSRSLPRMAGRPQFDSAAPTPNPCLTRAPFTFSLLLDPANDAHIAHFEDALKDQFAYYDVKVLQGNGQPAPSESPPASGDGLFYRRNLPHLLQAFANDPSLGLQPNLEAAVAILFEMPNASPTEFIGYPTGKLTETKYTVAFENGMLTSYGAERPSELLAGLNLPLDVVKAILSVPGELLTLRFNNLSKRNELTAEQVETLKQAYFLEQARLGAFPSTAPTTPPDGDDDDDGDGDDTPDP